MSQRFQHQQTQVIWLVRGLVLTLLALLAAILWWQAGSTTIAVLALVALLLTFALLYQVIQLSAQAPQTLETVLREPDDKAVFMERLDIECRRCVREFSPLTVILMAIDHVQVDVEPVQQPLLHLLARCTSRPGDVTARLSPRLFGLILPSTNEHAVQLAEQLHQEVRAAELNITVSIGLVTLQASSELNAQRALALVEQQLQMAQKQGDSLHYDVEPYHDPSLAYLKEP